MKVRKIPVEVDAIQWTGENRREIYDFLTNYKHTDDYMQSTGDNFYIDHNQVKGGLIIRTLEGEMKASVGDWIIQGVDGEFYPCKPDIFDKTYELVK